MDGCAIAQRLSPSFVEDLILLQYFGQEEAPTQRLIPLAELSSGDRWVLYKSVAEMIWADAQQRAREDATLARMLQQRGAPPPKVHGVEHAHNRNAITDGKSGQIAMDSGSSFTANGSGVAGSVSQHAG